MFKSYSDVSATVRTSVWNNGFSDYITPIKMTSEQLDNRLKTLKMSETLSKVIFHDKQAAGVFLYADGEFNTDKIAWLGGMAVDPQFRGQQLALKMLVEFEETASKNGVSSLFLEAIDGNDRAISIYETFGFKPFRQLSFMKSAYTYTSSQPLTLTEVNSLTDIGVTEATDVAWQCKTFHGYDCLGIYQADELIGYSVVSCQLETLVIHQLQLANTHDVNDLLAALQLKYTPKQLVASNLTTTDMTTEALLTNGFEIVVTQHQYIKEI